MTKKRLIAVIGIMAVAFIGMSGYVTWGRQIQPPDKEAKFTGYIERINGNARPPTIIVQSQSKDQTLITVKVGSTTKLSPAIDKKTKSSTLANFSIGDLVLVYGTASNNASLSIDATIIRSVFDTGINAIFSGKIKIISPNLNQFLVEIADTDYKKLNEITKKITKPMALSLEAHIYTFSSTKIKKTGVKSSPKDLRAGDTITVEGILNPFNGSVRADRIEIR